MATREGMGDAARRALQPRHHARHHHVAQLRVLDRGEVVAGLEVRVRRDVGGGVDAAGISTGRRRGFQEPGFFQDCPYHGPVHVLQPLGPELVPVVDLAHRGRVDAVEKSCLHFGLVTSTQT